MADVAAIREAIAANLAVWGQTNGLQVSPYVLANPSPPAAHVKLGAQTYDLAMGRGLDQLAFIVQVFVALTADIGAQKTLGALRAGSGAASVKQAVEQKDGLNGEVTLGGTCNGAQVTGASEDQVFTRPSGELTLMAEWTINVLAKGA